MATRTREFVDLVKQNPDLPIIPMVSKYAIGEDFYDFWEGVWDQARVLDNTLMVNWKEKIKDPMSTIEIEEKYVEIELPEPIPIEIRNNNFICFMVDVNKIDIDFAVEYVKKYMEILPEEVGVAILPSIEPKVLSKDTVNIFINQYKRQVEEKYK